jgi:hypothetical protein
MNRQKVYEKRPRKARVFFITWNVHLTCSFNVSDIENLLQSVVSLMIKQGLIIFINSKIRLDRLNTKFHLIRQQLPNRTAHLIRSECD